MTTNLLPSERNTRTTEQAVLRAYRRHTGRRPRLQADFEHGHWWVTELESGRQCSVVDTSTGFDFEVVTPGDED